MESAGEMGKDAAQQNLEVPVVGAEQVIQPVAPVRKNWSVLAGVILVVLALVGGGFFALSKFTKQKKLNSNEIATGLSSPTPATQSVSDLAHLPKFEHIKDWRLEMYFTTQSKGKQLFLRQAFSGYWNKVVMFDNSLEALLWYVDTSEFMVGGKVYYYTISPPSSKVARKNLYTYPKGDGQRSDSSVGDRLYSQIADKEGYVNKGVEMVNGLESYRFENEANHSTVWLSTQFGLVTKVSGDVTTKVKAVPFVGNKFGNEVTTFDFVYMVNQGVPTEEVMLPKDIKVEEGMNFDVESIMKKYGLPGPTDKNK